MLTVITPATTQRLSDLATVKAALDLDPADSTADALLIRRLDQASAAIAAHCGLSLGYEVVEDRYRFDCPRSVLILERLTVAAIEAVTEDGATLDEADVERDGRLLRRLDAAGRYRPWAGPVVTVRYAAGWRLPGQPDRDLPADIEDACLRLITERWHAQGRDPALKSLEDEGARAAFSAAAGLPADVCALLAPYRPVVFA